MSGRKVAPCLLIAPMQPATCDPWSEVKSPANKDGWSLRLSCSLESAGQKTRGRLEGLEVSLFRKVLPCIMICTTHVSSGNGVADRTGELLGWVCFDHQKPIQRRLSSTMYPGGEACE